MPTYVSLFRGLNVGGNHQVKMAELKALHEALGFTGVQTYIQSGNVVFAARESASAAVAARIEAAFEPRFGFRSEVSVRSADEMGEIIARSPFADQPGRAPNWIVVTFLPAHTNPADWQDAIAASAGPEEVVLLGDELHIYYRDGIGTSKLPATALGKKLKATGTARNWNTVLKLRELMGG